MWINKMRFWLNFGYPTKEVLAENPYFWQSSNDDDSKVPPRLHTILIERMLNLLVPHRVFQHNLWKVFAELNIQYVVLEISCYHSSNHGSCHTTFLWICEILIMETNSNMCRITDNFLCFVSASSLSECKITFA